MINKSRQIYLHGLESTTNKGKARLFREWFPGMFTPDFTCSFEERMPQPYPILNDQKERTIIGSSFGGLKGTVFNCHHPDQVRKLIRPAPALLRSQFASYLDLEPVSVPTALIHGKADDTVPLEPVRIIAEKIFTNLTYPIVEDDQRLHPSVYELDWKTILA